MKATQRPFRLKRAALRASPGSTPAGAAKPKSLREWSRVFFIRGEPNQLIQGPRRISEIIVRYFEMRDHDGRLVYYLFFASNNALGHLKMKGAMWKVDPMGEFSFSDSTDPNQTLLFALEPSMDPLAADMAAKFRSAGEVPIKRVETHVQDETAYLRKHMGKLCSSSKPTGN